MAHDLQGQHAVFRRVSASVRRDSWDAPNLSLDTRLLLAALLSSSQILKAERRGAYDKG